MASSSTPVEEKKRGRPKGTVYADPVPTRLTVEQLAAVDAWRREQANPPSRSEAIRIILAEHLKAKGYMK